MVAIVVHQQNLESPIVTEGGKLVLKTDNSGNVQFSKTAEGLKADVVIPEAQEVQALTGASIAGNTITFTQTNGSDVTVELPAVPVDVKLQSLAFEDGKLKATLSDGTSTEVEFNSALVVKALVEAPEDEKAKVKAFILDLIKGEEAQDLAGNTLGYFVKAN